MIDKAFLSTLNVLYVEDEPRIQEETTEVMSNFFNNVIVAKDGIEAFEIYEKYKSENRHIDAIISDINMPYSSGLELLEKVRKTSTNIPFVFTTAHSDSPYLLKAIKYKVTSYVLKPVNLTNLILEVQEYVKQALEDKTERFNQNDLIKYVKNIDKQALILKTDAQGIITYANELFIETVKYKNADDLIAQNCSLLQSFTMSKEVLINSYDEAKVKGIWKGKSELKTEEGSPFFLDMTLFPVFDDTSKEVNAYYYVCFLLSNIESKNKILKSVEKQDKILSIKDIIDDLKMKISKYKHINMINESLKKENEEKRENIIQIKEFISQ